MGSVARPCHFYEWNGLGRDFLIQDSEVRRMRAVSALAVTKIEFDSSAVVFRGSP